MLFYCFMVHAEIIFSVTKKLKTNKQKKNTPQTNKNKIATTIQQTAVPLPGQEIKDPLGD